MMMFGMAIVWIAVIMIAVWAFGAFANRPMRGPDDAIETLKRRLASGEINHEQYEQARKALQG